MNFVFGAPISAIASSGAVLIRAPQLGPVAPATAKQPARFKHFEPIEELVIQFCYARLLTIRLDGGALKA